jgi:hypothetical protein
VFTGKRVHDRILPMKKKAWAAKFEKYAALAGINEPNKKCHRARKARAEVAVPCHSSFAGTTHSW